MDEIGRKEAEAEWEEEEGGIEAEEGHGRDREEGGRGGVGGRGGRRVR